MKMVKIIAAKHQYVSFVVIVNVNVYVITLHVSTLMLAFYSKHCCFKVAPMTMSAGNVVTL